MNVHEFLNYRFEKTAASKAQRREARAVLADIEYIRKNLDRPLRPQERDALDRANMVLDRQKYGKRIAKPGTADRAAYMEAGKIIGDAKRAGKIIERSTEKDPFIRRSFGQRRPLASKAMVREPRVDIRGTNSGLYSKLQPTTVPAMTKQRTLDVASDFMDSSKRQATNLMNIGKMQASDLGAQFKKKTNLFKKVLRR